MSRSGKKMSIFEFERENIALHFQFKKKADPKAKHNFLVFFALLDLDTYVLIPPSFIKSLGLLRKHATSLACNLKPYRFQYFNKLCCMKRY